MPPKTKFTREDILEVAFRIAKDKGFSAITARSIAEHLQSSVAPIYVNFATIDDVIEAVVVRVFAISDELLAKQKGPDIFENIGKASLAFAKEYPVFFRELVLQPNPYMASYESLENSMIEALAQDESMRDWTVDERKLLFFKMRVFQLGLSVMVANGHVPSWLDDQAIEGLLMETGEDLLNIQNIKREEEQKQ